MSYKITKRVVAPRGKQSPWVSLFLYALPPSVYDKVEFREECERNLDKVEEVYRTLSVSYYRRSIRLRESKKLVRYVDRIEINSHKGNPQLIFTINNV